MAGAAGAGGELLFQVERDGETASYAAPHHERSTLHSKAGEVQYASANTKVLYHTSIIHAARRTPKDAHRESLLGRSLRSLVGEMRRQYFNATLTRGGVTLRGEGDVTHLMRTCRDPDVLAWAWLAWHDTIGPPARPLFTRAVGVMNSAARRAGECLVQDDPPLSIPSPFPPLPFLPPPALCSQSPSHSTF